MRQTRPASEGEQNEPNTMTRYHHARGQNAHAVKESASTSFHIGIPRGGYVSLGIPNSTRYQGVTHLLPGGNPWELFKTIEDITVDSPLDGITIRDDSVERVRRDAIERFSTRGKAVQYSVRGREVTVRITLDMRAIHDFATDGRQYAIQDVPGGQVVTYRCPRYAFCLAILGARGTYSPSWREVAYGYDARRGSLSRLWVCDALTFTGEHALDLRFGAGWSVQEAIEAANDLQGTGESPWTVPEGVEGMGPDITSAFLACARDVADATVELPAVGTGILAGYPWFYQIYTRDEAISLGATIALQDYAHAKRILLREIRAIREDGRIDNRTPASELASADGVGWSFLRLRQLDGLGALDPGERKEVAGALRRSLTGLEKHWVRDGLVRNGWKETWMDTTGGFEDGRPGARIEIQALTYSMYAFMAELAGHEGSPDAEYYRSRASLLRSSVRTRFFDDRTGTLADGVDDHVDRTARPNVFLAAYAAPELLSVDEWRRAFRSSLERLWLPWGGLATIDREHLLFTPTYTGENDRSYHRGDSWYFVNNIASVVLGLAGFERERDELLASSTRQALELGIPGHAAETSSAREQEACGCFVQTWSAATYVEAVLAAYRPSLARPGLPAWPGRRAS